jgi:CheY-like chemotaxis protein
MERIMEQNEEMKTKHNTILIAEDSPTQAEKLKSVLETSNYNVIVAKNGKEAMKLVSEFKPSLIISDIVMPEMSGYELCKEIKSNDSTMNIPVILLTSLARSEDVLEGISCGADNYLTKPYSSEYLLAHIEQILLNRVIYRNERVKIGFEILFNGKKRFITSDQQQMLSLLLSTYEAAVFKNNELVNAQEKLELLNEHLEELVEARTAELSAEIDIRKQAELTLIEAKDSAEAANKLKDAFIANISHEIRTPLNGLLGMTSLIKETFSDKCKEEDEILFDGIDFSSKRIIRTVDSILNYSRLQVGDFSIIRKNFRLSNVCSNLISEFIIAAKFKSLDLTFQNNFEDASPFADEYSITLVISNLIDNAIKYTEKGFVNLILNKVNDDIILDVKDSGIGISEDYIDLIFEPYRQEDMGYGRAYEGVGLGLAIVKKVINLNNYVISVKSKKGEGTTFSINFGKAEQLPEDKAKPVIAATILSTKEKLQNKVVLLVEDDLMNQVTIRRFMENSYNVMVTGSSDEAMDIIKNGKVDIILMDISIKGKKNGLELTKELKASKEFSHIPIIVVTAHAFEEDKQNALKAGCNSYLSKPFTKEALLEMVDGFARFTEE